MGGIYSHYNTPVVIFSNRGSLLEAAYMASSVTRKKIARSGHTDGQPTLRFRPDSTAVDGELSGVVLFQKHYSATSRFSSIKIG